MDLNEFLSYFDFSFAIVSPNEKWEQQLRNSLIEDGDLAPEYLDQDLICLVDLQGAYLGDIHRERYPIHQSSVSKIIDRMDVYIQDSIIDEFSSALENRDIDTSELSLEEMVEKCKALNVGDGEVCYPPAEAIIHPEQLSFVLPSNKVDLSLDERICDAQARAGEPKRGHDVKSKDLEHA